MSKKQFRIGASSRINIERCDGRISLQGSSKGLFSYSSDGDVSIIEDGDVVNVLAEYDLKAYVPKTSAVTVQKVDDRLTAKELHSLRVDEADFDIKVSDLRGGLVIGELHGDLEVKKSAGIVAHLVDGDVSAKEISGDIKIGTVKDGFSLRGGRGKVEVSKIMGDAFVNNVSDVVKLDSVDGDVILQGPLSAEKHHIIAAGDVIVYWPQNRNVQFLVTHKRDLENPMNLPNETMLPGEFQATIGDDSCRLIIEAGGDVYLRPLKTEKSKEKSKSKSKRKDDFDLDFDLEDLLDPEELIEKIGDGIKSMVMLQKRNKGKGFLGKIFGKAMQEVDEWAGVPEEREARKRAAQPQAEQPQKANLDSEEERRIILKMLDNGTITVDEAAERLKRL